MTRDIVVLGWQLRDFLATGHQSGRLVDEGTRQIIKYLTKDTFRPPRIASQGSSRAQRARSRSSSLDPLAELDQTWPEDWAVDRSVVRQAILDFKAATSHIQRLLEDPPSTGTTPRASPTRDQDHQAQVQQESQQNSQEDSQAASTRQTSATSADEAIYKYPIGPTNSNMDLNDPQVQAVIAAAASAAVAQYVRDHPTQPGPQGPPGNPGPPGAPGADGSSNGNSSSSLKADDVGFFDPSYEDANNTSAKDAPVVNAGRHVFYRDVYAFVDRLKDMAHLKGEEKIREVLPTCFRGTALTWHSMELTELEKRGLRNATVDEWSETLIEKFKERTSVALQHLQSEHYNMNDARQGRTPRSFAQSMLRHAKAAQMTSVYNQLSLAWNNLALEFRRDIPEPTVSTTISQFLGQLDAKENLWYEMARQQIRQPQQADRRSDLPKQSGQYNNRQGGFSKPSFPSQAQPYYQQQSYSGFSPGYGSSSYNYRNNFANRQYQPSQQSMPRPANPALPIRQPLQITAGNTSSSTPQSSNQPNHRPGGSFARPPNRPSGGFPSRSNQYSNQYANQYSNQYPSRPRPQGTAYQASESGSQFHDLPSEETDSESHQEAQDHDNYFADEENDYYQPSQEDEAEGYFASAATSVTRTSFQCRHCQMDFSSGNGLHKHLGNPGRGRRASKPACSGSMQVQDKAQDEPQDKTQNAMSPAALTAEPGDHQEVIQSTSDSSQEVGTGHAFRGYHYAMGAAKVTKHGSTKLLCFDTGCSITLVDRAWLLQALPDLEIRQMSKAITVRGLGSNKHQTSAYTIFPLLLPGQLKNGKKVTAMTAPREVHIVDNLKAKMLIGMDIMVPEKIDIITSTSSAFIGSCQVKMPLEMLARGNGRSVLQPVHAKQSLIIPPRSELHIPVHHASLPDRDFFFEPDSSPLSLYAHLVDASMTAVITKNDTDYAVQVPRNMKLGTIQEADFDNCYYITEGKADVAELATRHPKKEHQASWIKRIFKKVVAASAVALLAATTTSPSFSSSSSNVPSTSTDVSTISSHHEIPTSAPEICVVPTPADSVMPNGVTVYQGNPAIQEVVNEYPKLWEEGGFADIPREEWMRIPLKADWEDNTPKTARVYPLGRDAREVVNKTFDKLHAQGRLSWTSESTPFSYPVFVVWKTMPDGTRKGRAVIDIRGLNAITQADLYPLPLQADLIASVKDCEFITIIDCASFFYQWRVHERDRHKLTVVSHRGQETFNVAVMGYKNSPAYVQRQIDRILRCFRSFTRAYVDDVVIFSRSLEEHLNHLR